MKLSSNHLTLIVILLTSVASAQVSTGTPPFGSFGGGPFDTINLGNLNVHFSIPVLHKAGRGLPFSFDLSYDSSIWYPVTTNGTLQWTPTQNWGWTATTLAVLGYLSPSTTVQTQGLKCSGGFGGITTATTTYAYVDSKGRSHPFPGSTWYKTYVGGCSGPEWSSALKAVTTDGSGWTVYAPANQVGVTVTTLSGIIVATNVGLNSGSGWFEDTNGNELTVNSSGQYFDTLSGQTAVLTQAGSGTPASATTYTYTAPSANAAYSVNYTQFTVATDFNVSGVVDYPPTSVPLVSSITLPDQTSYSFVYETTPGSCTPLQGTSSCVTGRILEVTLPTGGTITYGYNGGSNGIESDGSTAGLTRVLSATTTAAAQSWTYSRQILSGTPAPGSTWATQVTDPSSNETVINFAEDGAVNNGSTTVATYNFYETQRSIYQGSISSNSCSSTITNNCLLLTTVKCYNAHYASCPSATVSSPIRQTDAYTQLLNNSTRLSEVLYNGYGLVTDDKEYNYGVALGAAPLSTYLVRETAISYNTSLTNNIVNRPSSIYVYDWTSGSQVTLQSSGYGYDVGTPKTTTGTPQQKSITGSRGNLTTLDIYSSGTKFLVKTFSYYDTGNVYQANDVNTAQTTYTYGDCGNSFPTLISEPLGLSRSLTWNCTGGVVTEVTDENSNNIGAAYSDPDFWRAASVTDQMSNVTSFNYNAETNPEASVESTLLFNSNNSVADSLVTVDGFGRVIFNQRKQGPSSADYDTVETDYNNLGQPSATRMPYSATIGPSGENTSAPATTTTYDALGRVLTVTDADGGTVTYTYTNNDVLQTVGGSGGAQTFQKQLEYDGLGRLTSVCEMSTTLPGVGTCAQKTSQTGYWTKYTSDALGHVLTVTQNAQASSGQQTRTYTYDWLGRMTVDTNPETGQNGVNGTVHYTYDLSNCDTPAIGCGDLAQKTDNAGNTTKYTYDALHRVLTAGNSSISGATLRNFVYDSASSYPSGVSVSNGKTRLIEAETTNTSGTKQTDEWFSYNKDGNLTDVYESTPNHSTSYYHTTASFWPTGALETLSGIPGVPTIYYGTNASGANFLDGEGRYTEVAAASGTNPVTSVSYSTSSTSNPLGALTAVTYGSSDSDSFTYDPNTGRAATYVFTVNGKTDTGTTNWYTNGTLKQLTINDTIPSTSDSQTCTYTYDGLARVSGTSCTSSPAWSQTFSYDAFGNITKAGNISFNPSYTFSNGADTNQFFSIPGVTVAYDANGNLTTDNLNKYAWDPNWGNMLTVTPQPSGTPVSATYDALGRMVEQYNGSAYTQILYSPVGKTALMNGSSLIKAFVYLPGGGTAIYNSSGLTYYRHTDWLGSSRLTSTQARGLYSSQAYAPFGEQYTTYPTTGSVDPSYTGQNSDTVPSLYDFTFREHSMSQGRWISPDPLGIGAANPANPQTWNRYAYVANNPVSGIDPLGLVQPVGQNCGIDPCGGGAGGGGGGGDGGCSDAICDNNGVDTSSDCPICTGPYGIFGTAALYQAFASLGMTYGSYGGSGYPAPLTFTAVLPGAGTPDDPIWMSIIALGPLWLGDLIPLISDSTGGGGGGGAANNESYAWTFTKAFFKNFSLSAVYHSFGEGGCDRLMAETFADAFNPLPGNGVGPGDVAEIGPKAVAGAGQAAASAYSVYQGLSVPLRSSIYRGLQSSTYGYAGALEEAAPYAVVVYAGGNALYTAGSAAYNGECH